MRKGGLLRPDTADCPAERGQLGIDAGRQLAKHECEIMLAELALDDVRFSLFVDRASILALAEPAGGLREAPLDEARSRPVEQLFRYLLERPSDERRVAEDGPAQLDKDGLRRLLLQHDAAADGTGCRVDPA